MARYTEDSNKFDPFKQPTVGLEFMSKRVKFDGTEYNLQIWDTAGQEEYRSLIRNYFNSATVCFLIFDVTRKETMINIKEWYREAKTTAPEKTMFVLVGNKIDDNENREVSFEEGRIFAAQIEVDFMEVSAKENMRIDQLFEDQLMKVNKMIKNNTIGEENMEEYGIKMQSLSLNRN